MLGLPAPGQTVRWSQHVIDPDLAPIAEVLRFDRETAAQVLQQRRRLEGADSAVVDEADQGIALVWRQVTDAGDDWRTSRKSPSPSHLGGGMWDEFQNWLVQKVT